MVNKIIEKFKKVITNIKDLSKVREELDIALVRISDLEAKKVEQEILISKLREELKVAQEINIEYVNAMNDIEK